MADVLESGEAPNECTSLLSSAATIVAEPEDGQITSESKSPYLNGVSVTRFWVIFAVLCSTLFTSCLDLTIMVSSHPVVTSYFHASNAASWLSTAFLLTYTSFPPLFGRLSDTIGRRGPYIFSIVVFTVGTVWCALAQSMTSFIIARAVCGLGAGGMGAMVAIIISDLVPIELRGTFQSYINVIFGLGTATGAAIGGFLADKLGWRWEFGVQVPILLLCLIGTCVTIPKNLGLAEGIKQKSLMEALKVFDYQGSITLCISLIFLILGLVSLNFCPLSHTKKATNSHRTSEVISSPGPTPSSSPPSS